MLLAYDKPPKDTAAIVAQMTNSDLCHSRLSTPLTAIPSDAGIKCIRSLKLRTNTKRDLSIGSARVMSICAAALSDLARYETFLNGWDGYDGEPIAPIAIHLAKALTNAIAMLGSERITDITPGPASDGSLDLEIRARDKSLTVTIYEGKSNEMTQIRTFRSDGPVSEEKTDVDFDALVQDLRWIMA